VAHPQAARQALPDRSAARRGAHAALAHRFDLRGKGDTVYLAAADRFGNRDYAAAAENMAEWLVSLQSPEGWFPGGVWRGQTSASPSVFNTGQILFGLVEAVQRTRDPRFATSLKKAVEWLAREQDADGRWRRHAYHTSFSPSYYAHVCWPLSRAARISGIELAERTAIQGLRAVLQDQLPNGAFSGWGFAPGKPAFTHTIAYTLQGCVESALLLGRWDEFGQPIEKPAMRLLRSLELSKQLAGAFDEQWKPVRWYVCLTGNCQMASVWMRYYERTQDARWLNAADRALEFVCSRQPKRPWLSACRGGIAGSSPLFGRYLMGRYPNWAAKFYIDAASDLQQHLAALWAESAAHRQAA